VDVKKPPWSAAVCPMGFGLGQSMGGWLEQAAHDGGVVVGDDQLVRLECVDA